MFKKLKELLSEINHFQNEIAKMGIFVHPYGVYVSQEMFELYLNKMEEGDQSSS